MTRRKFKPEPPPLTVEKLLTTMEAAAAADGKSLGEWMYERLETQFGLRPWNRGTNLKNCRKYELAATSFAVRCAAALLESMK